MGNEKFVKRIVEIMMLTLATFNIASGRIPDTERMNQLFNKHQIDIIGLQEVDCQTKRNARDLVKELAGEEYRYQLFSKAMPFESGNYGNALLSKYPVINYKEIGFLSYGEEPRAAQFVQIRLGNNQVITICNTHLSFESIEIRQEQSEEILQNMKVIGGENQVIMGDFNMDQSEEEWELLKKDYQLANGQRNLWLQTFREPDENMKRASIDNILVSNTIELVETTMIETQLSDHNLLKVKIKINEGATR